MSVRKKGIIAIVVPAIAIGAVFLANPEYPVVEDEFWTTVVVILNFPSVPVIYVLVALGRFSAHGNRGEEIIWATSYVGYVVGIYLLLSVIDWSRKRIAS